ncbi:MAG: DUF1428 domain-containing protein [Verrucomicrobia bacterium]|nr:DUF1428 domain-containing protein [Verrucomicrobiota bacterium]
MAKKSAHYVDGYVIPVPKKNVAEYRKMAQLGCKVWMKHGALDYRECVGEDLNVKCGPGFSRGIKVKRGETVVFAYIVYKSRAHRDKVNAAVMKDPELCAGMDPEKMPFDWRRMLTGGFETLVSA